MAYATAELDPTSGEELLRLWRDNLPVDGEPQAKLRWTYQAGPDRPGALLGLWHREPGAPDELVGCAGLSSRTLYCGGQAVRAGLNGDFAVDRQHRSGMPALVLQRAMARRARRDFAVVYGFPNEKARAIFARIGYTKLGRITRWTRLLHHAPQLDRLLHVPPLARVAGRLVDLAERVVRTPRRWAAAGRARVEWLRRADARFDELFARASQHWPLVFRRDAAFLNWRFRDHPSERYEFAAVVDRRSGKLIGYVVVTLEGREAHVFDHLAADPAGLGVTLECVAAALDARGMSSVDLSFLGAHEVVEAIEAAGFHRREEIRTVVIDAAADLPMPSRALVDPEPWYLTHADEDT